MNTQSALTAALHNHPNFPIHQLIDYLMFASAQGSASAITGGADGTYRDISSATFAATPNTDTNYYIVLILDTHIINTEISYITIQDLRIFTDKASADQSYCNAVADNDADPGLTNITGTSNATH